MYAGISGDEMKVVFGFINAQNWVNGQKRSSEYIPPRGTDKNGRGNTFRRVGTDKNGHFGTFRRAERTKTPVVPHSERRNGQKRASWKIPKPFSH
jgi:hypothetical protein